MAPFPHFFLFFQLVFLIPTSASRRSPILPKAAIFTVRKHPSSLQYVSELFMGGDDGGFAPVDLVLDLNGPFVWVDCESSPVLGSRRPIGSCSLECSMARPVNGGCYRPGYNSGSCILLAENTVSKISASGEVNECEMAMELWDGANSTSFAGNERFLFSCASNLLLKGLAGGAKGVFGLGDSRISIPSQFFAKFGFFERRFSICLSPSSSNGAIFLGGSPYDSETEVENSSPMAYTPLISKKIDGSLLQHQQEQGYYMDVSSIKVSGKKLSLGREGFVGAKLSTIVAYTTMETKIYTAFIEAYVEAARAMNLTQVSGVDPFQVCFSSRGVELNGEFGANVPVIDLVLQSEMVKWRVYGKNSMVVVSDEIMCLGFMDGGANPRDLIVIGGYQMEDHLLEFNLGNSMLGISSLVMGGRKCSDFGALGLFGREVL